TWNPYLEELAQQAANRCVVVAPAVSELAAPLRECATNKFLMFRVQQDVPSHIIYTAPRSKLYKAKFSTESRILACSVVCKNCGSAIDIGPPRQCPSASAIALSAMRVATAPQKPSLSAGRLQPAVRCAAARHALPERGVESDNSQLQRACRCPANFTGPRCSWAVTAYSNGVLLRLRSSFDFCTGSSCARVPLGYGGSSAMFWPTLRTLLASAINTFCRADPAPELYYVDYSIKTADSGDLEVAVYAEPPDRKTVYAPPLPPGSGRKKRAGSSLSASASDRLHQTLETLQSARVYPASSASALCDRLQNSASNGFISAGGWVGGLTAAALLSRLDDMMMLVLMLKPVKMMIVLMLMMMDDFDLCNALQPGDIGGNRAVSRGGDAVTGQGFSCMRPTGKCCSRYSRTAESRALAASDDKFFSEEGHKAPQMMRVLGEPENRQMATGAAVPAAQRYSGIGRTFASGVFNFCCCSCCLPQAPLILSCAVSPDSGRRRPAGEAAGRRCSAGAAPGLREFSLVSGDLGRWRDEAALQAGEQHEQVVSREPGRPSSKEE
uniref:EGF-like domain-containing protein n=1 Tax=Macrostomum lignano TaxID=282301 RepID=A0A1I8FMF0_9PLAT